MHKINQQKYDFAGTDIEYFRYGLVEQIDDTRHNLIEDWAKASLNNRGIGSFEDNGI